MSLRDDLGLDGPSIAELLTRFQKDPDYEGVLDLRKIGPIHLYQGFNADATTIKLSCLLFDHVMINELSRKELEYVDGLMDLLEPRGRAVGAARRNARMMLRKAARFQDETKILRDAQVLIPLQWDGGTAAMFQPACIELFGKLTFLGRSEMHDLARAIAGMKPLRSVRLFATAFGLSCLREIAPEDIIEDDLAVAVALSEVVGLLELFQMTPVGSDPKLHRALTHSMASRQPRRDDACVSAMGISVLRQALPNISLRSYEDTLEARVQLHDELVAFQHWLSQQVQQGKAGYSSTEISKTACQIASSVRDLHKKLQTADRRFLKDIARNLITASPPAILGHFLPSLYPAIGKAVGGLIASWGVWDAVKDRRAARAIAKESNSAVTFLLKLQRHIG